MLISELVKQSHQMAKDKGFYDSVLTRRNIPEALMLIVSEISEGLEELRKGKPNVYVNDNKPEGLGVELADAVIRIADLCGYLGVDLEEVIKAKMNYNSSRPFKHGKKF